MESGEQYTGGFRGRRGQGEMLQLKHNLKNKIENKI